MHGLYTLFYESPKTGDIYAHAQTMCTRPLLGGEGPGSEATTDRASKSELQCNLKQKCLNNITYIPSEDTHVL